MSVSLADRIYGTPRTPSAEGDAPPGHSARAPGLAATLQALGSSDPAASRYLLAMRFALMNGVGAALFVAALGLGWPQAVVAGDASRISLVIVALFLLGLLWCGRRVVQTSHELNQTRAPEPLRGSRMAAYLGDLEGVDAAGRPLLVGALRLKLQSRIAPVRHIANALVVLGLVGTVVGFIIALSGVDPKAVADPAAIGPMVSTLIQGMSVALYTTLVGAVLNLWLMLNYRLLESGTVRLFTAMVERGLRHG